MLAEGKREGARMKRTNVIVIILSALILLHLFLPSGQAADKIRYANHFKPTAFYGLPAIAAVEKGFFKEKGLEVSYVGFDSPSLMIRAMSAGDLDVGTYGLDTAVFSIVRKAPVVIIGDPKMPVPFALWVLKDSPLKEARQLKGAKIGVTGLLELPRRLVDQLLPKIGLSKDDIRYIGTGGGPPGFAALKAGAVDASSFSFYAMVELKARGEMRELLYITDYVPFGRTAQTIMANRAWAERNKEQVKKIVEGFVQGAAFVLANQAWSVEKMKEEFRLGEAAAKLAFSAFRYGKDGRIVPETIKDSVEYLTSVGDISRAEVPPLETIYVKEMAE